MTYDHQALFEFDRNHVARDSDFLAGVDEAGRGPLAGPVVAAAVILFRTEDLSGLNDSKKLTALKREKLFLKIARQGLIGVGTVDQKIIDTVNIYQATRIAMRQAVLNLTRTPDKVLVDGNMMLDIPIKQQFVVRGDQKSASIAAASIIAKVYRDAFMKHLDCKYPHYLFGQHKGYPTKIHIEKLRQHGPSPAHRLSFSPVSQMHAWRPECENIS